MRAEQQLGTPCIVLLRGGHRAETHRGTASMLSCSSPTGGTQLGGMQRMGLGALWGQEVALVALCTVGQSSVGLHGRGRRRQSEPELTGRDNGSECNNCLGESPRSIRETDFYMHVFKGISFAFLFPSPFFCCGIKGQKGALLTIKFNLNRKEGRTGTWLTRELAAGGGEHPPVPPSSVPPPPPSMGRSRGQHTALLPFPSSSLPLCCDLSIRGRSRLCVVPRVPTCP